jgi:hypothetical protein
MSTGIAMALVLFAACGWALAIQFYGWYRTEKWYAGQMKKLHGDALKHWDETREALREALAILAPPRKPPARKDWPQ